jgi:uncharacterized protein
MIQAQIFVDKDDLHNNQKVYEFIMDFLVSKRVAGATAYEGLTGFGANGQLQRPNQLFSFDEPPMMITFIDEEEKARQVLTELRKHFTGGLIITSHVEKW